MSDQSTCYGATNLYTSPPIDGEEACNWYLAHALYCIHSVLVETLINSFPKLQVGLIHRERSQHHCEYNAVVFQQNSNIPAGQSSPVFLLTLAHAPMGLNRVNQHSRGCLCIVPSSLVTCAPVGLSSARLNGSLNRRKTSVERKPQPAKDYQIRGTAFERPSSGMMWSFSKFLHRSAADKCFVSKSAGFSVPSTFRTCNFLAFTADCNQR